MTRPLDLIKDVTEVKELWKLHIRIVDFWYVFNRVKEEHLEMLLLDKEVLMYTYTIVTPIQI